MKMIANILNFIINISNIVDHLSNFIALLQEPEYIALLISTMAIVTSVYISYRDRRYMLAKEEYFKYQQIAEKVIAKLSILEHNRDEYVEWIHLAHQEETQEKTKVLQTNDILNKNSFEKNGEEVAALIYIYFREFWEKRNYCLLSMTKIYHQVVILNKKKEMNEKINWKEEFHNLEIATNELWNKPIDICNSIIEYVKEFKRKNLN